MKNTILHMGKEISMTSNEYRQLVKDLMPAYKKRLINLPTICYYPDCNEHRLEIMRITGAFNKFISIEEARQLAKI